MKQKLSAPWAQTPADQRREPTGSEIASGFECGPADKALFNELIYRKTGIEAEVIKVIEEGGLTPDENDLTQLWQALVARFMMRTTGEVSAAGTLKLTDLAPDTYYVVWFTSKVTATYTVFASTDNGGTNRTDYVNTSDGVTTSTNIRSQSFAFGGDMDILCIYTGTASVPAQFFENVTQMFSAPSAKRLVNAPQGQVDAIVINTDAEFEAAVEEILRAS